MASSNEVFSYNDKQLKHLSKAFKAIMEKSKKEHNSVESEGTYIVNIDGKPQERKYKVIGPEGYADKISEYIEKIGKSQYGEKMLQSLAKSKDTLYFVYDKGKQGAVGLRIPDPYDFTGKKQSLIMRFDPAVKEKAIFESMKDNLDARGISNTQNIKIANIKGTSLRTISTEMTFAHEMYHLWQASGGAPDYFSKDPKHQPIGFKNKARGRWEGDATRYTNQIRYDLGIPSFRKSYRNDKYAKEVDSIDRLEKRWESNLPRYRDVKNRRDYLIEDQWRTLKQKNGEPYTIDKTSPGMFIRVQGNNSKKSIIRVYGPEDLDLKSDTQVEYARKNANDQNKENVNQQKSRNNERSTTGKTGEVASDMGF